MSLLLTLAEIQMNMLKRGGRCSDEDDLQRLESALSVHKASQRSVQYPSTIWDEPGSRARPLPYCPDEPYRSQAQMQSDAER